MTNETTGKVDKCFDNTKDDVPNYAIDLIDGTRLYYRGHVLNPKLQHGDIIRYKIINTKTSNNGNPYTNVSSVEVINDDSNTPANSGGAGKTSSNRQEKLMFVTGITGRSMQSGLFTKADIKELTRLACEAFDENL